VSPAQVIAEYGPKLRHGPLWAFSLGRELAIAGANEIERLTARDMVEDFWACDPSALRVFDAGWIAGRKERVAA
jgi:hypothetical protein